MKFKELLQQYARELVSAFFLCLILPWLFSSVLSRLIHYEAVSQLIAMDRFLEETQALVQFSYQSKTARPEAPELRELTISTYKQLVDQQSALLLVPEVQEALLVGQASSLHQLDSLGLVTSLARFDATSQRVFFARSSHLGAEALRTWAILIGLALGLALPACLAILRLVQKSRQERELDFVVHNAKTLLSNGTPPLPSHLSPQLALILEQLRSAFSSIWPERLSLIKRKAELELILQTMDEGIVVLNGQCRIKSINQQARLLLDLHHEELRGQTLVHLVRVPMVMELLELCLKGEDHLEREVTLYRKNPLHLRLTVHRIVANKENSGGILLIVANVSSLKHLEEVRRDFVANVSHELRTPITAIRGFAETLADGAKNDPQQNSRFIDIIFRQSKRLESIIDDLLTLSQIEQTGTSIQTEQGSFGDLAAEAIELVKPRAIEKNTTIVVEGQDCKVRVNRALLEQVLVNLIDNAIKYCPDKSEIRLLWHKKDQKLWITVEDNGPGIPIKDQAHIFERFYRIDKARSRTMGGTGLGLSIVKHIVIAHGGKIELMSVPGEGARFLIWLPQTNK